MPDLRFEITSAEALPDTTTPTLGLSLAITNTEPERAIHSVLLRCQIKVECARRPYCHIEQERLRELFGDTEEWNRTLQPLAWMDVTEAVPGFERRATYRLRLCCAYDRNIAVAKYLHALESGSVPLSIVISGSAFYSGWDDRLHVLPVPLDCEVRFHLPVRLWQEVTTRHYRTTEWLDKFNVDLESALRSHARTGVA